jgi:tetratricopeptide (TPR) repeat protein
MLSLLRPVTEPRRLRGTAAVLALCLLAAACAGSSALRRGQNAERRQEYDLAVVEYAKALRLRPDDANARVALERAKLRASQDHFMRGRRFAAMSKLDQALVEYEIASELNPTNGDADDELRSTRNKLRAKVAVAREGKTELQTIIERARDLPPPGLDLPQGVKMPASLTMRSARSRARRAASSASPRPRPWSSSPIRRPNAASTRKRSSGRST